VRKLDHPRGTNCNGFRWLLKLLDEGTPDAKENAAGAV
jgi:hypothetical protein